MQSGEERWQRRMAPVMVGAILLTAVFFAIVLLVRFSAIEESLRDPPQSEIAIPWTKAGLEPANWRDQKELAGVQADFALEREIIARRYRQAGAILSLRLWTRLMGFLTGMIMAIVGAAFVLGKLTTSVNEIGGSAHGASISIKSASPGIVMATLGTILIAITLIMPVTATVHDASVYFGPGEASPEIHDVPGPLNIMDPAADADAPPRNPAARKAQGAKP